MLDKFGFAPTVVGKKGDMEEKVMSYIALPWNDTDDAITLVAQNECPDITPYDKRVFNAVCTLFASGKKTMSLAEIFAVITGYTRLHSSKRQIETIEESLEKMRNIRVIINLTSETMLKVIEDKQPLIDAGFLGKHSNRFKNLVIDSNMLRFTKCVTISEQGNVFNTPWARNPPPL